VRILRLSSVAAGTLVTAGLLTLGSGPAAAEPQPLVASATGAEEVPGPGDPDGAGEGSFTVDAATGELCYLVAAGGIEPAAAMHIHEAPRGVAGPVVVALDPARVNADTETCLTVEAGLAADILDDPAGYYLNIHTPSFPDGAVRGQLAVPVTDEELLVAVADGRQEVPGPGDPDGTAAGDFALRGDGELCYLVEATNIALPLTGMHIHRGAAGVAGPVVVPLDPAAVNATSETCTDVAPALLDEIAANPGAFYLNLHNAEFPDGAVRGQLAVIGTPAPTTTTTAAPTTTTSTVRLPTRVDAGSGGQAADEGAPVLGVVLLAGGLALAAGSALAWRRRGV
jgi:hypothetical protein